MKKKVNFNKQVNKHKDTTFQEEQSYCYEKLPFRGLGGINLYNEQYQRHLQKIKNPSATAALSQTQIQQQTQNRKSHKTLQDLFDQEYLQECEINDFLQSREKAERHSEKYNIAHQIQDIISNLKISQHSTANLLEQISRQKNLEEQKSFQNFDDLVQFYNTHNKESFALLLARIFEQLKKKMNQQVLKVKRQYEQKMMKRSPLMVDKQTQLNFRNVEVEVISLKKQLKAKEMEYNVLYDFKRKMLEKRDTYLSNMVLQQKIQEVTKLQEQNKFKASEIKRLQKQVDCFQDKFFNKIIQNQRKSSSLFFKSELESILEDQDDFKGRYKQKGRNVLRKSKNKQRVSRLSLGNDLIANKVMEYITSAFEINDKPRSLKELPNLMFNDFESQLSLDQSNSPKKFIQKKTLKKIIDKYQTKDKVKKSSLRKNVQGKPLRNQSVKVISSQKSMKQKKSNVSIERQTKLKKVERKSGPILSQMASKVEAKTMLNLKTKQRISQNEGKDKLKQKQSQKLFQQENEVQSLASKLCSAKVIKTDQQMKKFKKGVSFQIDDFMSKFSLKITKQINFCFNPKSSAINILQKTIATPETVDNEDTKCQDKGSIIKNDRAKLFKVKPKQKKHFKAVSSLNDSIKDKTHTIQISKEERSPFQKDRVRSIAKLGKMDRISFKENSSQCIFQASKVPERATISYQQERKDQSVLEEDIKKMMYRCKSKDKFYAAFLKFHKQCGANCIHIRKYMQMFQRLKSRQIRPTVKLNCQNLNNHIMKSNSIYMHSSSVLKVDKSHSKEQRVL